MKVRNDFIIMINKPPDPYDLVAGALKCNKGEIGKDSGLNTHPAWDSFGYLQILLALEESYGLNIDDEVIEKYKTFKAIESLYHELVIDKGDTNV